LPKGGFYRITLDPALGVNRLTAKRAGESLGIFDGGLGRRNQTPHQLRDSQDITNINWKTGNTIDLEGKDSIPMKSQKSHPPNFY